jgi:hypothetical protein
VPDDGDSLLINEFVRHGNSLFRISLIVTGKKFDFLSQDTAFFVPFRNSEFSTVPEIHSHFALVSGHGARCADPDNIRIPAGASGNKKDD